MAKMNQIQIINKFHTKSNHQIEDLSLEVLKKLNISNKIVEIESVNKRGMSKLNHKYRNTDQATDILSFPLKQSPNKENLLGNIFICEDVASERGVSVLELVKHGILHLIGFDHQTDKKNWNIKAKIIKHKM